MMQSKSPHSTVDAKAYIRNSEVVSRKILDETILVPISGRLADMQNIYALETTGAFLWDHLDGTRSNEDLLVLLLGEFDVDTTCAGEDLRLFVDELLARGLITAVGD